MEEEKAAAYYEELTRKGEGAARFKQGLGFSSSSNDSAPSRGSALASSSSFLSKFVRSSSPTQTSKFEKEAQLQAVQNKLKKKPTDDSSSKVSERSIRESSHSRRHRSTSRERRHGKPSRSSSRSRERDIYSRRRRKRSRSRSRSVSPRRDRRSERRNRNSRSSSPRGRRRSEKSRSDDVAQERTLKERNGGVDYSKMIHGYENMTAAEKVKARMKLQLNETAENDPTKGMRSGWERFEFDKDAPLDDEEIEAAEDDAALVKHIGQSFRFTAVQARKEEKIKAAHDEAMFGAPAGFGSMISDDEPEADKTGKDSTKTEAATGLLSEKVLAKQQGSWRDRARKAEA